MTRLNIFVMLLLLVNLPALAADPFVFSCDVDDDAVEIALCDAVIGGLLSLDSTRKASPNDSSWFVVLVTPIRHPGTDDVSAGISIGYVDRECGNFMISVHSATIITSRDELNTAGFAAFIEFLDAGVATWNKQTLPVVHRACGSNKELYAEVE